MVIVLIIVKVLSAFPALDFGAKFGSESRQVAIKLYHVVY